METFAGPAPSERSFAYKSLKGDLTCVFARTQARAPPLMHGASAFEYGSKDSALFEVGVVLDPTSDLAQSWSSILSVRTPVKCRQVPVSRDNSRQAIAERSDVYLKVWLNPTRQLTAPPIRRLYRHVLAAARDFTGSGCVVFQISELRLNRSPSDEIPPSAAFSTVPAGALLSTSLHAHPSWVILASSSVHDLDNIVGKEDSVIDATFEIDSLLIEGHAREATSFTPPRGLQVDLVSADGVRVGDTIVMANVRCSVPAMLRDLCSPVRGSWVTSSLRRGPDHTVCRFAKGLAPTPSPSHRCTTRRDLSAAMSSNLPRSRGSPCSQLSLGDGASSAPIY